MEIQLHFRFLSKKNSNSQYFSLYPKESVVAIATPATINVSLSVFTVTY